MPGNCPYRFQNSVLSWFPGRDETGNTVSSRLVLRFWINWKSRLVSNLDFRRLKSLVLSWKAFCCLDLSWIYLSCLDVLACLVLKKFQDFVPVSSCLVSRFSCPDPSLIPVAHLHGSSYSIFRVFWARICVMPEIARFWQSLIVPSIFIRDRVCFHLCSEEKFHYDETSTVQIVGWFG